MTAFRCENKECKFAKQCIQLMAAKEDAIPPCMEGIDVQPDADRQEETQKLSKPEPD